MPCPVTRLYSIEYKENQIELEVTTVILYRMEGRLACNRLPRIKF